MKYRADIDGLRCLAVVPVVLFHAGLSTFSGGYVGVDVFFVISGYLISGILRDEAENGRFSIINFYERRARRILPALFAVLVVTTVLALIFFLPSYLVEYAKSLAATAAFVSNLYFWKYSGYFESSALLRPLLHTWSLSVEEQFYIFMPLAVYGVHKFFGRRWLAVFGTIALLSLALSVYLTARGPTANFFLLPTRTWELLLGALLALRPPPRIRAQWAVDVLAICGLCLIASPIFVYTEATPFPGLTAVPPCLGAGILIYCGQGGSSIVGRALTLAPVVFVGQISYSLYLIHWPVAVFVRYITLAQPTLASALFIVLTSVVLAVLSWRYVERPFRKGDKGFGWRQIFAMSATGLAVVVVSGGAMIGLRGLPERFPNFKPVTIVGGSGWHEKSCFFEPGEDITKWSPRSCDLTPNASSEDIALLWGDSYAAHYVPGISANSNRIPIHIWQYTFAGCPPVLNYYSYARPQCQQFNRAAIDIVDRYHIKTVILSARWIDLKQRGFDGVESTLGALQKRGIRVFVIGQSPVFVTNVDVIGFMKGNDHLAVNSWKTIVGSDFNVVLKSYTKGAIFIDPMTSWCSDGLCPYRAKDEVFFGDNGHFTKFGAQRAVAEYFPLVARNEVAFR